MYFGIFARPAGRQASRVKGGHNRVSDKEVVKEETELKLGVQNYTLRDLMAEDFFGTLAQVRQMGVRYCEMAGLHGHPVSDVAGKLSGMDMSAVGGHFGLDQLNSEFDSVLAEARALGYRFITLPWVSQEHYQDGWATFARNLEPVARKVTDAGFTFCYHNHSFEFASEPDGRPGLEAFYAAADPRLIQAEIDTYWVKHGGQDPAAYLQMVAGRAPIVHFKDMAATDGSFCEPGYGTLDWDGILAACARAGSEYAIIELDTCPRPPLESVRLSAEYLRGKGIVE